jgi:hypothetical protein
MISMQMSAARPKRVSIGALAEKFNGDLSWRFLDRLLYLFGSVGQSIRVDIYAYPDRSCACPLLIATSSV